jgi:hypothetical protein
MTEFVMLPIFSEDGRMTKRSLKVDTRHFLGSAGSEIAHRFIEVVTEGSTAEEEIEMLDRIMSGFPIPPRLVAATLVTADKARGSIELMDVSSAHPRTEWRPIPGYSQYIMSTFKMIATASDQKSVSIMRGRLDNALLTDDDGVVRRMSINHLFRETFPELS